MQGNFLRDRRLAAGVSYPKLAREMGVALSRVPAIERTPAVTERVAAMYLDALGRVERSRASAEMVEGLATALAQLERENREAVLVG